MHKVLKVLFFLVLVLFTINSQAQNRFYHVYVDTDNNNSTGCDVNLPDFATAINGTEGRLTITTDSSQLPNITSTSYHLCNGATFGAGTNIDPAALGLNTSLSNHDVFEAQIPRAALGVNTSGSVIFYYVTESTTASDIVLTNNGGGPIALGFTFPVPSLGLLALALLIFAFVMLAGHNINRKLSVMLVLFATSSVAWAMAIVVDGQTTDWNNINPVNTDPTNDTSVPGSFADLTQVFLTEQNDTLFLRMDVVDVENQAPVANDTSGTTLEESTVTITVTGSDAEGDALTFVAGTPPANGTLSTFTVVNNTTSTVDYTPNNNFNGVDTFTFAANDGQVNSAAADVDVTVTPVNDAPTFTTGGNINQLKTAGPYSETWASDVSAGAANESAQNLTFNILSNDNAAIFTAQPSLDSTGVLSFTGVPDATGTANLTVNLTDDGGTANGGNDTSVTVNFSITLQGVNDEPTFTAGGDQAVLEDAGAQTVAGWATAISAGPPDESGQVLTFIVTNNDDPALFSVAPQVNATTGDLTFTPAADANGIANISVFLMDDGGTANGGDDTSPTASFNITVNAVNDAPSFNVGLNQSVLENAPAQTVNGWATAISAGPADESGQTISFTVTNDNNGLFSSQPAIDSAGNLTYTPTAGTLGSAQVDVVISDDGGVANGGVDTSAVQTFTISVTDVNDAPSFTAGPNQTINEDAAAVSIAWATAISPGPANEAGQNVTFNITANDNAALFSAGPTVAADGNLSYTAAADANGTANITIELMDDGGTANGGEDTSPPQNFSITITPVNDVPSYTSGGDVTVDEDSGAFDSPWATAISAGPSDESGQTLNFNIVTVSNGTLFSVAPTVDDSTGNLSFTPAAGEFGTSTVTINLMDDGGTASGGVDTSTDITFDITIDEVNEAPVLDNLPNQSVDENTLLTFTATASDPNVPAQNLSFSLGGSAPAGATITAAGVFSWTPTEAQGTTGSFTFDVTVTDDGTNPNNLTDTQSITVTVNKVNSAPVLATIGSQSIDELTNLSFTASASDSDDPAQNLTFSLAGTVPSGANISTAGAFSWTPTEVQGPGSYTFDVVVTDDGTNPANLFDTETITVTVNEVNIAPVLTAIGNQSVDEETLLSFNASATDSNLPAQTLSFSLSGTVPTGASITSAGAFTWTPTEAQGPGTYTFDVLVTDNGNNPANLTDSETITVTVNEVNAAPTANSQSTTTDDATPIVITLTGSDPEGDALTFSIVSGPAVGSLGSITTINATSASVTYTPTVAGTGDFTFRVNDGSLDSPVATVTLPVTSSNTAPTGVNDAYNVTGNVGISVPVASGVTANDTDPELDTLTVTAFDATSTQGGTVSVNANGSFTYDPPAGYTGTDSFDYTLSDGALTDTATVTLTVGDMIWFIDNSAAAGGDGRLVSPFNTISSFNSGASDAAGEVIHIDFGDGTSTGYNTGITLLTNQRLIGQGVALSTTNTGITYPTHSRNLPAALGNPTLVTSNANSITLSNNNTVKGLTVGNTGTGTAIHGLPSFGTLTVSDVTINGTGKALELINGTLLATFDAISSTSSLTNIIAVVTVEGFLTVNGGNMSGSDNSTVDIFTSAGSFVASFNGVTIGANNGVTGLNGINFNSTGSATAELNVNNSTFTGSKNSMIYTYFTGSGGGSINIGTATGNQFIRNQDQIGSTGSAIDVTVNGLGSVTTNITNNSILAGAFQFQGDGILVNNLDTYTGTHRVTIENNTIGTPGVNGSAFNPADNSGDAGIVVRGGNNSDMIALINNNNVYDYNASGIEADFVQISGNYDITITNNTINDALGSSGFDAAIAVFGGVNVTSAVDACVQVEGNVLNDPTNEEIDVDVFNDLGSYNDPGLVTLTDAGLETHLLGTNAATTVATLTSGILGGGASCILP